MANGNIERKTLFNLVQNLGIPSIMPPLHKDKLSISVQFIVPNFRLGNQDKDKITKIVHKCGREIWGIDTHTVTKEKTKEPATLVTIAFYSNPLKTEEETTDFLNSESRLIIERFLGLLSFLIGLKLSASHIQYNITEDGKTIRKVMPVSSKSATNEPKKVIIPEILNDVEELPEDFFSALFWLRRGLAERDPIENFSSLMNCIQIMARRLIEAKPIEDSCPSCGVKLAKRGSNITSIVRDLLVTKLGVTKEIYERLWKARNAIVAHGNKPVTAEVFLELTDLKYHAVVCAFNSIKLYLNVPLDSPPLANPDYFVTDAFMYID